MLAPQRKRTECDLSQTVISGRPASRPAVIIGEVALDRDGILHGWCWDPARPSARLTLDVLVDDVVVAGVLASRFREDVRNRKFGDGYHGFTLAMTKQLGRKPAPLVIAARERDTGRVFWQKPLAADVLGAGFHHRLATAAGEIDTAAHATGLAPSGGLNSLAAALDETGRHLNARAAGRADSRDVIDAPDTALAFEHTPLATLILTAGPQADRTGRQIAAAAGAIAAMAAELILIDDGADPRSVLLASRIGNLRYVFYAGPETAGRNAAARDARSDRLMFLSDLPPDVHAACDVTVSREAFLAAGGFDERLASDDAMATLRQRLAPVDAASENLSGVCHGF